MKKIYSLSIGLLTAGATMAQLPVSNTQQNKKFVLEEFTGMRCTFCPDGHKIANQIMAANPGNAFAINIHTTSSYSNPQSSSEPDYRTADGDAISNMPGMNIAGFPQGANNRRTFGGSAMAISRGSWTGNANTVMAEPSYINVAGEATLDITTRVLTLNIEAYYTGTPTSPDGNRLTVALLQNNINGMQTSGNTNPAYMNADGTYRHMHMLRDIITTNALGDSMGTQSMGSTYTRTITYTLPAMYKNIPAELGDMELVIYITDTDRNVISGGKAPITLTGFTTQNDGAVTQAIVVSETCVNTITPYFTLKNQGGATMTSAVIEYSVNSGATQTYNWTGSISPFKSARVDLDPITFTLDPSNTLTMTVTSVNGVADENTADNAANVNFNETTAFGNTVNMNVRIVQDRYGSETTWEMFDENGTSVASGGPYADLAATGTQINDSPVIVPASGCYKFELYDSYGDGINSGYGAGSAQIKDGQGLVIYANNGIFSSQADREFKVTSNTNTTGLEALSNENFNIYPNPAKSMINVSFEAQEGTYVINLVDLQGRNLVTRSLSNVSGQQTVALDLNQVAPGNYLVVVSKNGLARTERIVVQ
jgi:hypothetical protein